MMSSCDVKTENAIVLCVVFFFANGFSHRCWGNTPLVDGWGEGFSSFFLLLLKDLVFPFSFLFLLSISFLFPLFVCLNLCSVFFVVFVIFSATKNERK